MGSVILLDDIRIYNRALTDEEVALLYETEKPTETIALDEGLVAYYPFNGNANDESGNGNNGIVNGATLTSDRYGNSGKAYNFDGINNWISTPMTQTNLQGYSVSAWVKPNFNENKQYVVIQNRGAEGGGGKSLTLHYDYQLKRWGFACDGDFIYLGTNSLLQDLNNWVHVTGTWSSNNEANFNPNQFKIYFNGVLQSQNNQFVGGASIPNNPIENLKIGKHDAWNSLFKGKLDDIRIYNRALSDSEVQALYNQEKP